MAASTLGTVSEVTSRAFRLDDNRPNSERVSYRKERPEDRPVIAEVVEAAFGSSAEAELVQDIRQSGCFIPELSVVALTDARVVGHVMVSYATLHTPSGERLIAMLSPLAVDPSFQRRGIGSALVRKVTAEADARAEPLIVLEGSPRFYGRLGFEHSLLYGIEITLPSWAPPEAAQVLRLSSYDVSIRGRVTYPLPSTASASTDPHCFNARMPSLESGPRVERTGGEGSRDRSAPSHHASP